MADLETAVPAALARVKHLEEEAGDTEQALEDLEERLEGASLRLEGEGRRLCDDLREFLERVQEHRNGAERSAQQATDAVGELQDAITADHAKAAQELADAGEAVAALSALTAQAIPDVQERASAIEAAARDLQAEADTVRQELERAIAEAVGVVGQLVHNAETARESLDNVTQAVERDLSEHLPQVLQDKFDNWLDTLNEVERIVGDAFEEARQHASDVLDYSLLECATRHQDAVEDIGPLVQELAQAAQRLAEAVQQREAELAQAREIQRECTAETGSKLGAMTAALQGVRALLARFSFVSA